MIFLLILLAHQNNGEKWADGLSQVCTDINQVNNANCPESLIINETLTWVKQDDISLKVAKAGCKKYYGSNSCLKTFIKKEELRYHVICKSY